jgi:hypothetical protein
MSNYDKIEDYLQGRMSANESQIFKLEIEQDKELGLEVEVRRFGLLVVEKMVKDDMEAHVQRLPRASELRKKGNIRLFYRCAAAIVFIVLGSWVLFYASANYSNTGISKAALNHGENSVELLNDLRRSKNGAVPQFDQKYVAILKERERKKVKEAIFYFESIVSSVADNDSLLLKSLFNLARAQFLDENYIASDSTLTELLLVPSLKEGYLKEKTKYCLSLTRLYRHDIIGAKTLLKELEREGEYFEMLSMEVLRKLESPWRKFVF